MSNSNLQKNAGFSLVELVITLFIVSILMAGVLQLKEMYENAKVKSLMKDFNGVAVAYYAFRDRRGRIPGDSNRDGRIDEDSNFWLEIRNEGYIVGSKNDNTAPMHVLEGAFSVLSLNGVNSICADNVTTKYAKMIDNQMDDGQAQSGNFVTVDLENYSSNLDKLVSICRELSIANQ